MNSLKAFISRGSGGVAAHVSLQRWMFQIRERTPRRAKYRVFLTTGEIQFIQISTLTSSTIGGGRGCNTFVPVLRGNGTKIAPTGDRFDQPPGQMRWIWGKLADYVGDHVVSSPEGAVLMTPPGTKSSYPRPP